MQIHTKFLHQNRGRCVCVCAKEWEAATSQSAKQGGVRVQQFPGCVGTLWGCPAPEVWTDGFGGAHRKVFGESVVLMFTASWLNHWGACWQDQRKWGHSKRKISVCLCLCVGVSFSSVFPCFSCWTAGHDYKKAIMICLTEHITESASNQQNELQSKWREWHSASQSNKRWHVNSPQSHCSLYIHHSFSDSGALQQKCHIWQRKYGRNKHFPHKVHRSVGSGNSIKYLVNHGCPPGLCPDQDCDSPRGE